MADPKTKLIIDGDNRGARRVLDETGKGLQNVANQAKGLTGGLGSAMSSIAGLAGNVPMAAAGGLSIIAAGMATMIKNSIDAADELYAFSQQVGLSTEFLSTFGYAANMSNVETETLNSSLIKFNKNIVDAASGSKDAASAFKSLGISTVDSKGNLIDTETALMKVADQFAKMPDGAQKSKTAMDLFGRGAAPLIPLLNEGSAGINKMREEARRLGIEIDTNFAKNADAFNDGLTVLQAKFQGMGVQLTEELAPTLLVLMEYLVEMFSTMEGGVGILDAVGFAFKVLATTFIVSNSNLRTLIALISGVFEIMGAFLTEGVEGAGREALEVGKEIGDIWSGSGEKIAQLWESSEESAARFQKELDKIKAQLKNEDAEKAAKKLREEWEKTKESLTDEKAKKSMSDLSYQFYSLEQKVASLQKKFGGLDKDGYIAKWGASMRKEIYESAFALEKMRDEMDSPGHKPPGQLTPVDTSAVDEKYQHELDLSTAVTDTQMAQMVLLGETGAQMYGNLGSAMEGFYNATGQKSKALFAVMKAFKVTEIAMSTYSAMMAALAPWPEGYGPVWGIPMAVSIGAMGAANIANVVAAQPGTGMNGVSVASPSASGIGNPGGGGRNDGGRSQVIEVHIHSAIFDKKTLTDIGGDLVDAINNAGRRGHVITAVE